MHPVFKRRLAKHSRCNESAQKYKNGVLYVFRAATVIMQSRGNMSLEEWRVCVLYVVRAEELS
jgi:hypothetical protein